MGKGKRMITRKGKERGNYGICKETKREKSNEDGNGRGKDIKRKQRLMIKGKK